MARAIGRRWAILTVLALGLMIAAGWGLASVRTTVSSVNLLLPDNPCVQDFRWFERNVGPLIPVEVILRVPRDDRVNTLEMVEMVRDVQQTLGSIESVGGVVSAATFVPAIPRGTSGHSTGRRAVLRRRLEGQRRQFAQAGYLYEAQQQQSWRVSGRVLARAEIDYAQFLRQIAQHVEPVVDTYRRRHDVAISVTYTGVTPVVEEAQRALLVDLFKSFLTALVLVTIVMICVLRSVRAGLLAMVPNVFPVTVLFGLMGWMDLAVDIGAVMTASVALGIAVDGTLHFLNWFRREVAAGQTRVDAVRLSYRHCGRALAQTTVICALGLLIYTFSGFVPARNFAWMMLLLLIMAMVGDLVVLPALLVGPLGRWLAPVSGGPGTPAKRRDRDTPVDSGRCAVGGPARIGKRLG